MEPQNKQNNRILTERQYLGVGYNHRFVNDTTGEVVFIPCTKEEYEALGSLNGHLNNPSLDGHTWICSEGGTVKVDTEDGVLKEDEFVTVGDEVFVRVSGVPFDDQFKIVPKEALTAYILDINLWQ